MLFYKPLLFDFTIADLLSRRLIKIYDCPENEPRFDCLSPIVYKFFTNMSIQICFSPKKSTINNSPQL